MTSEAVAGRLAAHAAGKVAGRVAEPFPLDAVELGDGVFTRARDQLLHLAHAYPVDRLLAVFRANAGLDTRGALPPGGWEGFGHPDEDAWGPDDYPGREAAPTANLLRGHYAGHFLSMLALAHAGTADAALKAALRAKVDDMVDGLAEVQAALAASGRYSHPGFLAAYGEWQFSRLEGLAPYGEIWAPYYTCHKIMAGLLEAHRHAGSQTALEVAAAMGRWVHGRLSVLPADRRREMWSLYIAGETGGMNEVLCDLAVLTCDPTFVETARLFDLGTLLETAAAGRDVLDGMHANQHAATLLGYLALADLTGERAYLDAVTNIWDMLVPGRTYAHGGSGENELWGPAGAVAGDIGNRNAETCVTYNMLKLARALFERTGEARYAEYYERAVTNHVLGSRRDVGSDDSPEVTYMFPVHPGALREYDNVGTCCGGTGLENHVKYQDSVYFRSTAGAGAGADDGAGAHDGAGAGAGRTVWVNLYVASTLRWPEQDVRLVQETAYPLAGTSRLRVDATGDLELRLRVPGWVAGGFTVTVDGQQQTVAAVPGQFVSVRRQWRPGTVVEIGMPLTLRAVPAPDDASLVTLELGPTVLLARSATTTWLPLATAAWRSLDGTLDAPLAPADDGTWRLGDLVLEPAWSGSDARYHMYLRRADARIVFAGPATGSAAGPGAGSGAVSDSGVPNAARQDGATFLDVLWSGTFASRAEFLRGVLRTAHEFVGLGLLSAAEAAQVLRAAARSSVGRAAGADPAADGSPAAGPPAGDVDAAGPGVSAPAEEAALLAQAPTAARDGSAPRVEIVPATAPGVTGWYHQPAELTVTARADDGAADVEVRVGDGPWAPAGPAPLLLGDGVHTVTARAVDSAGRERHVVREVSVDTEPPRTTATVRRLGARGVEINLTATDDVSGVDAIRWKGPDTFWATFGEPFTRALSDRPQVIEFTATDRAGNEEPVQTLVLPAADRPPDVPDVRVG